MKALKWYVLAVLLGTLAVYAGLVSMFGFKGFVALSLHFSRVAIAVAVLILYIPKITEIFKEVPPPRRDYLLAGIIWTWLSAVSFSFWNEAGRLFGTDTSIFSSYVAGTFSLFLVIGGVFHLIAPDAEADGVSKLRKIALVIGIILSVALVFIAPQFRPAP